MVTKSRHLVSIITPTYNHSQFIGDCIDSVLAQTYENWEMIIIDDGSTDSTWPIIKNYATKDSRIFPFLQENKGIWRLAETYNSAFRFSKGEYITMLEGDDYWPNSTLLILVDKISSLTDDYGVVFGKIVTVGTTTSEIIGENPIGNHYSTPLDFSHQIYTPIARIPPQASIIRRQALIDIDGFVQYQSLPLVDRPTFLEISLKRKFYHIDQILAFWRQHESNTTNELSLRIAAGAIPWVKHFFDSLDSSTIQKLHISKDQTINAHRKQAFLSAASVLRHFDEPSNLNTGWNEMERWVLPHLSNTQVTLLYLMKIIMNILLRISGT